MAVRCKKLQQTKVDAIEAVKRKFESASDFIFTDYRGLTVEQITSLRRQLREKGCEYKVVKNNFARIAFDSMQASDAGEYLAGPTAIALAGSNSNEVAKILFEFAKDAPALTIKGGLIGKTLYDAAMVESFSKLPGKDQLIAMLMSAASAPMQNLVYALNAVPTKLARTLQAVADKKAQ